MEVQFSREKLAVTAKLVSEVASRLKFETGWENDDFVKEVYTGKMEAMLLSRVNEKQIIKVYTERCTFFDWLFRRKLYMEIEVNCKEVLRNPPKLPVGASILTYHLNKTEDE